MKEKTIMIKLPILQKKLLYFYDIMDADKAVKKEKKEKKRKNEIFEQSMALAFIVGVLLFFHY